MAKKQKHTRTGDGESKSLSFSLQANTIPMTIISSTGEEIACEMRELAGKDRDSWMNLRQSRIKTLGPDSAEIRNWDNIQSDLVQKSIWRLDTNKRFTLVEVNEWPSGVLSQLFDIAIELSALKPEEEDEEGND